MTIDCRWAQEVKGVSAAIRHCRMNKSHTCLWINLIFSNGAEGLWKCFSRYPLPDLRVIYSSEEMEPWSVMMPDFVGYPSADQEREKLSATYRSSLRTSLASVPVAPPANICEADMLQYLENIFQFCELHCCSSVVPTWALQSLNSVHE